MGTKEEARPMRIIKGWSGKIRPLQTEAGRCRACGELVYVDAQELNLPATTETVHVHWSCS